MVNAVGLKAGDAQGSLAGPAEGDGKCQLLNEVAGRWSFGGRLSVRCLMTNHRATASRRVQSLASQRRSGWIFIFNSGQQVFKTGPKTFGIKITFDFARATQ